MVGAFPPGAYPPVSCASPTAVVTSGTPCIPCRHPTSLTAVHPSHPPVSCASPRVRAISCSHRSSSLCSCTNSTACGQAGIPKGRVGCRPVSAGRAGRYPWQAGRHVLMTRTDSPSQHINQPTHPPTRPPAPPHLHHVSQPLHDQAQRLLGGPHAPQHKHHFPNQATSLADLRAGGGAGRRAGRVERQQAGKPCSAGHSVATGRQRCAASHPLAQRTTHSHLVGSFQGVAGRDHEEVQEARGLKLGIQLNLQRTSGRQAVSGSTQPRVD